MTSLPPQLMAALIPLGAFLAISLVVWVALSAVADRKVDLDARLGRLMNPEARKKAAASLLADDDRLQAKMSSVAGKFGQGLRPKNESELGKARETLLNAGFRSESAVAVLYGCKVMALLVALLIAGPVVYTKVGMNRNGLCALLLAGGIGFYLPGMIVGSIRKKRMEGIFLGLPDAIDLMVVCV